MNARIRNVILIITSSLLVAGIGLAIEQTAAGGEGQPTIEPPALAQVIVQGGSGEDPIGFSFAPPTNSKPPVSADEAAKAAWEVEGAPGSPSAANALLENVTWPQFGIDGRDVWAIVYPDACQPLFYPDRELPLGAPVCHKQPFMTLLDATTGEYLVSFATGNS